MAKRNLVISRRARRENPPPPHRVELPGAHGSDIDRDGNGTVAQQRVYQLIRQPGPITARTFEITFPDPGARVYCLTFG